MSARGKNINLYLMDGDPNGRIKCTLANWTGVAYKIPRTELDKCKDREDLSQSGVYFLFGTSDEIEEDVVYIGQAGVRKNGAGILNRLLEHRANADKDYWTEAIVFTTSNNSFGQTEISYLENRFASLALTANRYKIKNSNTPNLGNITEEKESELEEFIDYAKIVMGTLGHKVLEPLEPARPSSDERPDILFYIKRNGWERQTVIAECKQTTEGFVVLKGSQIALNSSDKVAPGVKRAREKVKIDENGILQEDVLFGNPFYAATFVIGRDAGPGDWKTSDGKTLREIETENTP